MRVAILNSVSREYLQKSIQGFTEVGLDENPEVLFLRSADIKSEPEKLPKSLYAICRAGSGVDNIPLDWCNANGIAVFNAPGANANSVKETVICALLGISHNLFAASEFVRQNTGKNVNWNDIKSAYLGKEVAGKNILVVGLGHIGRLVARACKDLGMNVFGFDPYVTSIPRSLAITKIRYLDDERIRLCDYITLHTTLNPEAQIMVAQILYSAKHGVIVLNFAREELIDKKTLIEELDRRYILFYGADFVDEELQETFGDRVLFLPHLGASTIEAEVRAIEMVTRRLKSFWFKGDSSCSINFPRCRKRFLSDIRIVICTQNRPAMIAQFAQILANAGYNISRNENEGKNGIGYNIVDIDNPDDRLENVMDKIRKIQGVMNARVVKR